MITEQGRSKTPFHIERRGARLVQVETQGTLSVELARQLFSALRGALEERRYQRVMLNVEHLSLSDPDTIQETAALLNGLENVQAFAITGVVGARALVVRRLLRLSAPLSFQAQAFEDPEEGLKWIKQL